MKKMRDRKIEDQGKNFVKERFHEDYLVKSYTSLFLKSCFEDYIYH